jgi:tetratricopeptide (TPR) repeat protein
LALNTVTPTLPAIAALVRSGAVDRGWALFEAGGYGARTADPAALAVKGRLLKARARCASGAARAGLMAQAAAAYGAAHALDPAPYLAINAASLSLLAGDQANAAAGAQAVLALLDAPVPPADTPYFLAATRTEALLLLGDQTGAVAVLEQAILHDPDGWDDRASTLAQLREVLAAQGRDAAWLSRFAPPANLHFAGHMGFAAGGGAEAALSAQLAGALPTGRFGFAWGALAAGADIVIAEHLLTAEAELHAVLPCPADQFEAQSVAPAGAQWAERFRALLPRLASLRVAATGAGSAHDPLATAHAGELAIGGALNNARRLGTAAAQLIVVDESGGGANTARQAALWREDLGAQVRLTVPRDAAVEALFPAERPDPARALALHVAVGLDGLNGGALPSSDQIAALTAPISAALSALPAGSVRAAPGLWEFAVTDLDQGLAVIASLLALSPASPAIGAHLAISALVRDPASGALLPYGPAPGLARQLLQLAPAGSALASDALAVTLASRAPGSLCSGLYLPPKDALGGAIHTLLARYQ